MFRSLALWMLGIPIPIIILIWLFTWRGTAGRKSLERTKACHRSRWQAFLCLELLRRRQRSARASRHPAPQADF